MVLITLFSLGLVKYQVVSPIQELTNAITNPQRTDAIKEYIRKISEQSPTRYIKMMKETRGGAETS